jgi:hypothetical protein
MMIIWTAKVQIQQMTSYNKMLSNVQDEVAQDRGTHETSASGSVAGRRSCPV